MLFAYNNACNMYISDTPTKEERKKKEKKIKIKETI